MRRSITLAIVSMLTVIGSVAAESPAGAVVAGQNGRILFIRAICSSDARRCWEIVAADSNDSHETVIAGPYRRRVWDDHFIANWSPDGKTVIFMAQLGRKQKIWQVDADGTGLHEVFAAPRGTFLDDGPTFTPDGQHIIFTRCCGREVHGYALWEIDLGGTRLRHLTTEYRGPFVDSTSDNLPQVSPDGKSIAYYRNVVACRDPEDCGNRVVTVNIHGGHRVQLMDPAINEGSSPNWSPDSKRIVFEMYPPGGGPEVGIVNADGTGLRQLTFGNGETFSFAPSFSPDGTKIIFSRFPSTGSVDLFTMNPDGSGVTNVTRTASIELWPQWAAA
jgi:Tol biopolymer transport system component